MTKFWTRAGRKKNRGRKAGPLERDKKVPRGFRPECAGCFWRVRFGRPGEENCPRRELLPSANCRSTISYFSTKSLFSAQSEISLCMRQMLQAAPICCSWPILILALSALSWRQQFLFQHHHGLFSARAKSWLFTRPALGPTLPAPGNPLCLVRSIPVIASTV